MDRNPDPITGEFHCRFHIQDADDLANKIHLYFLHFGVKQLAESRIKASTTQGNVDIGNC